MFDPTLPQEGTPLDAVQMRSQFNGLKDFIDALNAQQVAGALVESVGTGNTGDPASAGVSLVGGVLRFSFVLPRGDTGPQGQTGADGPPFATAVIDSVTTLNAGDNATVSVSFDGSNVHFTFGIPRGNDGPQGIQGFQGPPGEVSASQLAAAIMTTSSNTNAVSQLGLAVSDPPTQAEMQAVVNKLDELIAALRRP